MKILECSSVGDKRFSALTARVVIFEKEDTIENHYQLCKRIGDFIPAKVKDIKGKRPTHINLMGEDFDIRFLTPFYNVLWVKYLDVNPELVEYARTFDDYSDRFKGKNVVNCQADVIRKYVKNGRKFITDECEEFIAILKELKGGV